MQLKRTHHTTRNECQNLWKFSIPISHCVCSYIMNLWQLQAKIIPTSLSGSNYSLRPKIKLILKILVDLYNNWYMWLIYVSAFVSAS